MITADSKLRKQALGEALKEHDPEFLGDIKMFVEQFGLLSAVSYESNDFETHKKVVMSAKGHLERLKGEQEEKIKQQIAAAKEAAK